MCLILKHRLSNYEMAMLTKLNKTNTNRSQEINRKYRNKSSLSRDLSSSPSEAVSRLSIPLQTLALEWVVTCPPESTTYVTFNSAAVDCRRERNFSFCSRDPTVTRRQSVQCSSVPRNRHTIPLSAIIL